MTEEEINSSANNLKSENKSIINDLLKELELENELEKLTNKRKIQELDPNEYDRLIDIMIEVYELPVQDQERIKPKRHIKPNNKLAKEITHNFINKGTQSLIVRNRIKPEIITNVALTYEANEHEKFTLYDREVHDSVITLYEAGNKIISAGTVYRAMNGLVKSEKASPQAIETVTRSLEKSRLIMLDIDCKREKEKHYKDKDFKSEYKGFLFDCNKLTVPTKNQSKIVYEFLDKPILYEYAQMSKQIINVPIELLHTEWGKRNSEELIIMRGCLLRHIEDMKWASFQRRNNKIRLKGYKDHKGFHNGIYEELDVTFDNYSDSAYKKKTYDIRKNIEEILTEWKNQKYVDNYEFYKQGKTIIGVAVSLPDKKENSSSKNNRTKKQ